MTWEILIMVNTSFFALVLAIIDFKSKILPNEYVLALSITSIILIGLASDFNFETIMKSIYVSFIIFVAYLIMFFLLESLLPYIILYCISYICCN